MQAGLSPDAKACYVLPFNLDRCVALLSKIGVSLIAKLARGMGQCSMF